MSSNITMKDVAIASGVSLATVSKVINGDKTVSQSNAKKVWDAVKDLGYKTNYAAKLLRTSRSQQINVIIPNIFDPNFSGIFTGIERILYENEYAATLCVTSEIQAKENFFLEQALRHRVAGVILVTCQPKENNERIQQLVDADTKVVHIEREPVTRRHAFLEYDNRQAINECVSEMLSQGLRRLLLVAGPGDYSSEAEAIKGFETAFGYGAAPRGAEYATVETNFDKESAFAATVRHINHNFVPEAIVTTSLSLYQGAYKATDILQHRLANRVRFISLGDSSWCHVLEDSPAIIGRDSMAMGRAAAEAVLNNIKNQAAHQGCYIQMKSTPIRSPGLKASHGSVRFTTKKEKALNVLLHESSSADATINLLGDFESRLGVKVHVDCLPPQKLYSHICDTGTRLKYDVIQVDQPWGDEFVVAGWLENLDEMLAARPEAIASFPAGVMDAYSRYSGSYFSLPYRLDTQLLFYRRDLFENQNYIHAFEHFAGGGELRPPKTWVEFNRIAKFFTKRFNPDSPTEYGIALGGLLPHGAFIELLPRLWAYGADIFDERGRIVLDDRSTEEALANYVESYEYAPPDSANNWWREQMEYFRTGQVAMTTLFHAPAAALAERSLSKVVGKLGYAVIPGGCPVLGGWSLAIVKGTKNREKAFEWMCWATGEEMATLHTILGGATATTSLYQSSELLSMFPWLPKALESFYISRKRLGTFSPRCPGAFKEQEVEKILGSAVHDVLSAEKKPVEAIGKAVQDLRALCG